MKAKFPLISANSFVNLALALIFLRLMNLTLEHFRPEVSEAKRIYKMNIKQVEKIFELRNSRRESFVLEKQH